MDRGFQIDLLSIGNPQPVPGLLAIAAIRQ